MLMGDIQSLQIQIPHEVAQQWGWFLVFGIALAVLGGAAVVRAFTATIATMMFFGVLLLGACGIEIVQAVMVGHWAGFFHHLLERGIYFPPSQFEAAFVSAAHTAADLEATIAAVKSAAQGG